MGIDAIMLLELKSKRTPDEIESVRYQMCEAFGHGHFFQDRELNHRALEIVDPKPYGIKSSHAFLEVNLWTRYYGIGYERGNFPFIYTLAIYLERKLSPCNVYYGGDHTYIVELFDTSKRDDLMKHFVKVGRRPYRRHVIAPICTFCNAHPTLLERGGSYESVYCPGCGLSEETRDGGISWKVIDDTIPR